MGGRCKAPGRALGPCQGQTTITLPPKSLTLLLHALKSQRLEVQHPHAAGAGRAHNA